MRTAAAPAPDDRAAEIVLLNPNRYPEAPARPLRRWLAALLAERAPGCASLGVRFAGDLTVRRMNRVFRGLDKTTDVLSFPGGGGGGGAGAGEGGGHLGDILISVPAARRQAAAAGHSGAREVRLLLLHGVLHCLGYDHETDGGEMERLERRLRRRWLDAPAGAAPLRLSPAGRAPSPVPPRRDRSARSAPVRPPLGR
jgi:probable rRNA maturation factor